MMKIKKRFGLFLLVASIQLAVPLYMAWHWEDVLVTGRPSLWQMAPVDPYDAFKGRYIDLRFRETKGMIIDGSSFERGQIVYAIMAESQDGKVYINGICAQKPREGMFVNATFQYLEGDNMAHVVLPFKRYYVPEGMALAAEKAYQKSANANGVAAVRIKDGYGVVEQVYIEGKPLLEYIKKNK